MKETPMEKHILIVDGHPDEDKKRFCHALASAYEAGAKKGGHHVRRITVAELDLPLVKSAEAWTSGSPPAGIRSAQGDIQWANHLVFIYPLWLGSMPAVLKAFFEQTFRPGFAISKGGRKMWPGLLRGKTARIVITMGMPAWLFRWYFLAHSLKSLERNILRFAGIGPVRETLIGGVGTLKEETTKRWLATLEQLGTRAQ